MSNPSISGGVSRRRILGWACLALIGGFALLLVRDLALVGHVPQRMRFPEGARADVAIVPSGDPGHRTSRAVDLLRAERVARIVISGRGYGGDSAAQLGALARARGADPAAIWLETEAENTYDNLRLSLALLARRGATPRSLVVVTSRGHAARAGLVAAKAAPEAQIFVDTVPDDIGLEGRLREGLALLAYRILGRASWW